MMKCNGQKETFSQIPIMSEVGAFANKKLSMATRRASCTNATLSQFSTFALFGIALQDVLVARRGSVQKGKFSLLDTLR